MSIRKVKVKGETKMKKVYGYKEKDLSGLIEFLEENKSKNKSACFSEYAVISGKAKGTVRNMYYALMKNSLVDEELKNIYIKDKKLRVNSSKPFSIAEEDRLVKYVLNAKREGVSVRKATADLSNGDMKLALRYQNKFRNILKKDENLRKEFYGERTEKEFYYTEKVKSIVSTAVFDALVSEITSLIRKISFDVEEENEFLRKKLKEMEKRKIS